MADVLSPERSSVEPRRRSVPPPHSAWAAAGVAVVVFWIAYDKGSYPLQSRTGLAIAVWWALGLGVAVGIWPIRSFSVATVRVGVLLTALAGWTGASALWVSDAEGAYEEFVRMLLYVGVFALAVVSGAARQACTRRRRDCRRGDGRRLGCVGRPLFPERDFAG